MRDDSGPTLGEVGEFSVIERLTAGRRHPDSVLIGPGDDAALLAVPDGRVAISTDMLVEGRHFRLDWSSPHDVGRKAIAQNAADVEAMGARATAFVVAFGAPAHTPEHLVQQLSDGMWEEARRCGDASIIGGDLVASPQWVVSVTVFGDLQGRPAVTRGGARAGDVVALAGHLGRSAAGYAALTGDAAAAFPDLVHHHLVPEPPYGQGAVAATAGATAMTDVSDGLLADLGHIATASGATIDLTRADLRADADALSTATEHLGADPWRWVLTGGEDHALVATFPGTPPPGWRRIGTVVDGEPTVRVDGHAWSGARGWESFN
jgi:thiamine-monophosphate kinase